MENQDDLSIKDLVNRYLQEQMHQFLKVEQKLENASMIFLDNHTINMIIMYLLLREENQITAFDSEKKELPDFDRLIEENKRTFNEIIQMVKERD